MKVLRVASCVAITLVLVVLAAWAYLRSGRFDIRADQRPGGLEEWIVSTLRESSLARQSGEITAPEPLDAPTVARGALLYADSCEICHGGPGRQAEPFAYGLHPVPPSLDSPVVQESGDGEFFWVIGNGLRFTGMPAFGGLYDEEDRWALVAFLRRLPDLLPAGYEELVSGAGAEELRDDGPYGDPPASGP